MGRGCLLAVALCAVVASAHAAHITQFSPEGTVATVESVKATFNESVIVFGDAAAPAPLQVSCDDDSIRGDGRWTDARNWTYVFRTVPGPGVECAATVDPAFRTLNGQSISGKTAFAFGTGGPQVISSLPYGDSANEDQVFVLRFNGAVDPATLRDSSYCSVQGLGEAVPVRLIDEPSQRKAILETTYWDEYVDDPAVQLLQCKRLLPAESRMSLVVGKGVATPSGVAAVQPQTYVFKVRSPFKVSTSCQRENANAPCAPVLPITVGFNAPVAAQLAAQVRLRTRTGDIPPDAYSKDDAESVVQQLVFSGPFEPEAELALILPDDLHDDAGRTLANAAQFPLTIHTGPYPALVKFSSGNFGTVERFAHVPAGGNESHYPPTVPLTVRNVEPELLARDLSRPLGTVRDYVARDDEEILRWYASLQRLDGGRWTEQQIRRMLSGREPGQGGEDAIDVRGYSLLHGREQVKVLNLPGVTNGDERPFEVIGVPVGEPGFHVLEVESPRLGEALLGAQRPMFVRSGVLVTNLGVHLKQGRDDVMVWVTALDSGHVVADAEIRVLDCSGELVAEGRSDENGIWHQKGALNAPSYCDETGVGGLYVAARISKDHPLARGKDDFAFVLSDWNRGMEPWRFNVPTDMAPEPTIATHTVFDRSLFRAGETVSMKHFARVQTREGLALPSADELPNTLVVVHEGSGQTYQQELVWKETPSGGLSAYSQFALTRLAKLGQYTVTLQKQGTYAAPDGSFRVEEFKLPVLAGSLKISQDDARAAVVAPSVLNADLQVSYVSGGPASGLPIALSGVIRDSYPTYRDYEEYSFEPPLEEGGTDRFAAQSEQRLFLDKLAVTLDEQGGARVHIDHLPPVLRPSELRFEAGFSDPNGQIQTLSQAVPVWPSSVVVGLRADSWIQQGRPLAATAVVLSPEGKPQAGVAVEIRAVANTTYTVRQRMVGGFYSYQHETRKRDLGTVCEGKSDEHGQLQCEATLQHSGSIELVAAAADGEGRRSLSASRIWVMGGDELWFDAGNDDRIDIIPDKKAYEPGQTAEFQVRMPFRHATALVAVEREGVLYSEVLQLKGNDPRVRIPVQADWGPNVYVSVLVIRGRLYQVPWYSFFDWGWKQPASWLEAYRARGLYQPPTALVDLAKPAFRFGLTQVRVDDTNVRLNVEVATDRAKYRVRDEVQVHIKVTTPDGAPASHAQVAFAAVDEALLELAANPSWNLLEAMRQRRSYGVQTSTGQSQVVGRRHYGRKALPAGGGGGKSPTRELLDTLLLWQPDVQLDAQGKATIVVPLNDSITAFRLVALADEGAARFGEGATTITATQDLQVISGLPALVRSGDSYRALVTVRNTTGRDMQLEVRASYQTADLAGESFPPQTIDLAPGTGQAVHWEVTAPEAKEVDPASTLRWTLEASERGAEGAVDRLVFTQVLMPNVPVTVHQATLQSVDESAPLHLVFKAPQGALAPTDAAPRGGLEVYLQSSLAGGLPGVVQWFKNYSYTCLEQLGSRAIGMRSVEQWHKLMASLPNYLDEDGLARYFPGSHQGSEVLTAYLLAVTHEAASVGLKFDLPDDARNAMREGLVKFVEGRLARYRWAPSNDLQWRKLLVLEALAREGVMRPSMLDSIQIVPNRWPTSSVIDWFSILTRVRDIAHRDEKMAQAQQILRARLLNRGTELTFAQDDQPWWLMRSSTTSVARLLSLVADHPDWSEAVPRLAQGLIAEQRNGAWLTTTENLLGALAIERFSQAHEGVPVTGRVHVSVDGASARIFEWSDSHRKAGESQTLGDDAYSTAFRTPADVKTHRTFDAWPASHRQRVLDVVQEGYGKIWVWTRSLAAVPINQAVVAGYEIQRRVTPVSRRDPSRWSVGDVYRVSLEVNARSDGAWVVVDDPIPAGATILGSGLGRDSGIQTFGEHTASGLAPNYVERTFNGYRAYFEYLPAGATTVQYTVRLNTAGRFNLPPTRVEALYQPDLHGVLPQSGPVLIDNE